MTEVSEKEFLALVADAARAPSIHNVQPARWRRVDSRTIELHADSSRWLRVSDPEARDDRLSLGAALEGMSLALSSRRKSLKVVELAPFAPPEGDQSRLVARLEVAPVGADTDPLASAISVRATWRGKFARCAPVELHALQNSLSSLMPVTAITRPAEIDWIAERYESASLAALGNPGYFAELWSWLRLSRRHPRWDKDGLNADAMALHAPERALASVLMRPKVFMGLARTGLARWVVTETPKIVSASAILLPTAPVEEDPLVTGRSFYRLWLRIAQLGLALCPMSALSDTREGQEALQSRFAIGRDQRIVNVLRVGRLPKGTEANLAPRLDVGELVM